MKIFQMLFLLGFLSLTAACTGAAGPKGDTGAAGPTGPTGPAGPPGSANVIYSAWVTSPNNSEDRVIDGTCVRMRRLPAPLLTQENIDRAAIIVYMRVGSIGPYKLPYTSDAGGATNQVNYSIRAATANDQFLGNAQPAQFWIYRHTFNTCRFNSGVPESFPGQPVLINLPQSLEYRYIIIPGGVAAASIQDLSYQEVVARYNIPE
ncbi:MAG: hypothetical protein SFU83_22755 [Meiothermus sp.]|nr:hypothetical protein [Meiothermus sp.]